MNLRLWIVFCSLLVLGCGMRPEPKSTPIERPPNPAPLQTPDSTPTPELPQKTAPSTIETPDDQVGSTGKTTTTVVASRSRVFRKSQANLTLALPQQKATKQGTQRLNQLKEQARWGGAAGDWRALADYAVEVEDFATAHDAYTKESKIYRELGHTQAAIAEEIKARKYATESGFYVSDRSPATNTSLERLEPPRGCYLGAFIDRDDEISKIHFQSQTHGDIDQFNKLVKRPHATFFMYRSYGMPFPMKWAEYVKRKGAFPHIAWEPRSLDDVKDDEYLRKFLRDAASLDHPVILRFASEMNGQWTRYHGDPEAYKEKFRLVFQESRKAPKVALMWCPNAVPQKTIKEYYPGDDYVDWVGVNFYSVPFLDNDPNRPGDLLFPTDHFRYVYQTYAEKKPIAIGEWAASQASALSETPVTKFAVTKMSQLYATLPTRYPRVKMVNWYDCNNLIQARDDRKLNNYQITKPPAVRDAYQASVASKHYLEAGEDTAPFQFKAVAKSCELGPKDELRVWLKSYDPVLKLYFLLNGKVIHASDDPNNWFVTGHQLRSAKGGLLIVKAYDSKDRFVTKLQLNLI